MQVGIAFYISQEEEGLICLHKDYDYILPINVGHQIYGAAVTHVDWAPSGRVVFVDASHSDNFNGQYALKAMLELFSEGYAIAYEDGAVDIIRNDHPEWYERLKAYLVPE